MAMSPTPLRVIITLYTALLVLASWLVAFIAQMAVLLPTFWFVKGFHRNQLLGHVFRKASWMVTGLNPFWRVKRIGTFPPTPKGTLIMCNHLSNADPFVLCNALYPWETKYIAKSNLFKIPFGGWCMHFAGDLAVHFTSEKDGWGTRKGSVGKMMDNALAVLKGGGLVTIFPEGQRSPTGELCAFKDGFFRLAVDNKIPILVAALSGSERAFPFHEALLDRSTIYVTVGETLSPKDGESFEQLRERVSLKMAELKSKLPPVQMPETSTKAIAAWNKREAEKRARAAAETKTTAN